MVNKKWCLIWCRKCEEAKPGLYIVELENSEEFESIMKKAKFLKDTGSSIGIDRARTKKEREEWRRKEKQKCSI